MSFWAGERAKKLSSTKGQNNETVEAWLLVVQVLPGSAGVHAFRGPEESDARELRSLAERRYDRRHDLAPVRAARRRRVQAVGLHRGRYRWQWADGGVDLVLRKPSTIGNEPFLVRCTQGKAFKVSVNVARELHRVMAARGAAGWFVMSSG